MRIIRAILLIIALTLLIVSVRQFRRGYANWQQAQVVEKSYQAEIRELEAERDRRKQRVKLLKNDTLTKERLVRKRFGYVKPGEIKYKIVKPAQSE